MNIINVTQPNTQYSNNINFNGSITNFLKRMLSTSHVEKDEFINTDLYDALSQKAKTKLNIIFESLQKMIHSHDCEYNTKNALDILKKEKESKEREFLEEVLNFIKNNKENFYADATECGYEVDEEGKFILQTCTRLLYELKNKEKIPNLKQDIEKARKLLEEIKNS